MKALPTSSCATSKKSHSLQSTVLGVNPSLSTNELKCLSPKNTRCIFSSFSLRRQRKTLLHPTFFSDCLLYFWQVPSLQKMWVYVNSKFILITLIQPIWLSRLFFFLCSFLCCCLVFVIIFPCGWTGERIRENIQQKAVMLYSVTHPACSFLHPSTHEPIWYLLIIYCEPGIILDSGSKI